MASNDPAHPPVEASGTLPYPSTDQAPGALPYPPTDQTSALPYPPGNQPAYPPAASTLPYPDNSTGTPQMDTTSTPYPPMPAAGAAPYPPMPQVDAGSIPQSKSDESKGYTDAPPPYSPPVGGAPYPNTAPGQVPPPQPGYAAYPAQQVAYPPPGTVTVTRTVQSTGGAVVVTGNCPRCGVGILSENFTLLGICCAFWFFPLGIICCLSMRERRCTSCGAAFT